MKQPKNLREMLGITQYEMADMLGVSRSLISLYELGRRDLPAHAKEILVAFLPNLGTTNLQARETKRDNFMLETAVGNLIKENT